jgi:hypothetical protein
MMEWFTFFSLAGTLVGILAVGFLLTMTKRKLAARNNLVKLLAEDQKFVSELKRARLSDNFERPLTKDEKRAYIAQLVEFEKYIEGQLNFLARQDQALIEQPLRQSSNLGRASYVESIVRRVDERLQHAY